MPGVKARVKKKKQRARRRQRRRCCNAYGAGAEQHH